MWWYRDGHGKGRKDEDETGEQTGDPVLRALAGALSERRSTAECLLAMSLLVDSRIEAADGNVLDGPTWAQAEQLVQAAVGGPPVRLYNAFSRDYGDGYSGRTDLPEEQRRVLESLRAALSGAPDIVSLSERTREPEPEAEA